MGNKSGILIFLSALFPGVGYMYLGQINKGVKTMLLFLFAANFFSFIGLGFISHIITIPFWFYTFFDTFKTAEKIKHGEQVEDHDSILKNQNGSGINLDKLYVNKRQYLFLAWFLLISGVLATLNKLFYGSNLYHLIKFHVGTYLFPVLLICAGIYLLVREQKAR